MALARYSSALRRRLLIRAAERQARAGEVDAALAKLADVGQKHADPSLRQAALRHAASLSDRFSRRASSTEFLRSLVRLDDTSPDAWADLVEHLEADGAEDEALYGLGRLAALRANDRGVLLRLATLTERLGDSSARRAAWERLAAIDPENPVALERLGSLVGPDEAGAAIQYLRRLAAIQPSEENARRLATALDQGDDPAGSIGAWREVLLHNPTALDAHRRLAELVADPREALPHLRIAAEVDGEAATRRLAKALERTGDTAAAIAAWRTVTALRPSDAAAYKQLARLAERIDDAALAADAWKQAAEAAPGDLEAARSAGGALLKADRLDEAIATLRRYTLAQPSDQKVRRSLLTLLRRSKDTDVEIDVLRELLALNAGAVEFAEPLGERLVEADRLWEAIPYLEAAADAAPQSREAWVRLAKAFESVDSKAAALAAWRHVSQTHPDDAGALERQAALLDALERRKEAASVLVTIARLQGDDRKAWLRVAARAREMSDVTAEIEAYERLARFKPSDVSVRQRLVELYFTARRRPEALPHLAVLAEAAPDAAVWRSLAELREASGDQAGMVEALRRLVDVDPLAGYAHERLAKWLDAAGDRAAAVPHLAAVAEAAPDSEKAWRRLADRLQSLGRIAEAAKPLQHLSELVPDDLSVRDRLAAALVADDRADEATPHYWALANAFPKDIDRLRRLIILLKSVGRTDEMIEASRRLLRETGGDAEVHADLAKVFIVRGEPGEALPHLRAIARLSGNAADWRRVARLAETMKDSDRAMDAWRRAVAIDEEDLTAHDRLARAYLAAGDERAATPHLDRLARAKPDDLTVLKRLAKAQEAIADLPGYAHTMGRLSALQPQDRALQRRWAAALLQAGVAAEALALFRALDREGDEDGATLAGLGIAAAEVGELDLAIDAWSRRLKQAPDDLEGLKRLSALLYSQSRRSEALPYLQAIARLDPNDVRSRRRIASILAAGDDREAELEAWRAVLEASPDDAGAHEQIVDLLEMTDLEAALPHMEAVARLTPDKVKPWKRLGKWLQHLDRNDEAMEAWKQSLSIAPDDVETQRRLAQLHLLAGDYRAGLRHLDAFGRMNEEIAPATAALVPEPPALDATPLVSAVILSLEGAELLESLFSSFHATNTYPSVELIVVDHGSGDGTAGVLDAWQEKLPIRRIMRDANYSYSASCNLGVRESRGELVLLLNNDVVFHEDVLGEMVRHLAPDVGIVGLKQYNSAPLPEDVLRPYHIGVRFVWDEAEAWFKPKHAIPTAVDTLLAHRAAYFPGVTASVMLCRKADYLAVGGLDEAYVYGHEDMDFCCKMRMDRGRRIVSLNSRAAFHRKNSTRRADDFAALQAQRAANEALFRDRWEIRIAAECIGARFNDDGSWRGWAPTVGLWTPLGIDDARAEALLALGEALSAHCGWQVRYLIEGEPTGTDARGLDAVIADATASIGLLRTNGLPPVMAAFGAPAGAPPSGFDLALPAGDSNAAYAELVRAALGAFRPA